MTLTEGIAREPPKTRRFRLLAPLLVLLSLVLLAMVPGLLVYISADEQGPEAQSIERYLTYQGR